MSRPFASARLKTDRADEHLKCLEEKIRLFMETEPYPISVEFNANRTECRFYISVTKPLPESEWGLLVGDCIHNARSALDHLTWEIAETFSSPDLLDRNTQFPVFPTRDDWTEFVRRGQPAIKRLPVYAQGLIEQAQPYHADCPVNHPLWQCNHFDVVDKHKLIPVVAATIQNPGVSTGSSRVLLGDLKNGPFIDGAQVGFLRFSAPVPPEVKMHTYFTVVVVLASVLGDVAVDRRLRRIIWHVRRLVQAFEDWPHHHDWMLLLSPPLPE